MSSGYRVAVVGATGNVGREILNILAERQFPLAEVAAVASPRSTGDIIDFGESGQELKVKNLEHFDFSGWDIALFAAGSDADGVMELVFRAGDAVTVITQREYVESVIAACGGRQLSTTPQSIQDKEDEPQSRDDRTSRIDR